MKFYRLGWLVTYLPLKLFYRIKVLNKKNFIKKGKCVGICNHYNLLDVPAVAIRFTRQMHFLAKKELYNTKIKAWLFNGLGAIPINRDSVDIGSIKAALTYLKNDRMLMLFPEGTRNKSGTNDIQEVKAGAAMFAIKGKAPIVPMALYRPPKAFKCNYLMVGEPFDFSEFYGQKMTADVMEAAGDKIYQKMTELKNQLEEYVENRKKGKTKNNIEKLENDN